MEIDAHRNDAEYLDDPFPMRLAAARDIIGRHLPGGVVVACSGGPDSVALAALAAEAYLLAESPPPGPCLLCHLDHGLRQESAGEAAFVRDLAGQVGLTFRGERLPVPELHAAEGGNLEALARRLRYAALDRIAREAGCANVMTGHSADDAAETLWLWFLRGTGLRGLRSIAPRRPIARGSAVTLVRPLLALRREELLAHLRARGLGWLEDPSNRDLTLRRNWLRHKLFPMIREDLGRDPVPMARRLARHAEQVAGYLYDELDRHGLDADLLREGGAGAAAVDRRILAGLPDALAAWYLAEGAGAEGGLDGRSLRRLLELIRGGATGAVPLPGGRRATVEAGRVCFHAAESPPPPPPGLALMDTALDGRELPGDGAVDLSAEWRLRAATRPGPLSPPESVRSARFDADALALPLRLVRPGEGMRVRLLGGPGTRRLSRLLVDRKVPAPYRDRTAVLVDAGGRVLWVAGLARGDAAPVGPATRRVLCLDLERRETAAGDPACGGEAAP
ncbi:MAG: tRNA lysidine(34) synthetase TilS [Candidatus Krumholzibacteriota bacterium]|nr:tRNA lysidine(34) synthetase TilS [Candidatus Krumholzibacteriota bacterium]